MPFHIHIPPEYECSLRELADEHLRDRRQEAAWLLMRAIEQALRDRDRERERRLQEVLDGDE
jgi:hypothetical protein